MQIGVFFPQTEIGSDPVAVRDFAQAVESMGFSYVTAYDHVLGASAARYDRSQLKGSYREKDLFHEPFVLLGFLAGITTRLGLATSVLILPQRQTALVAKQAAEVDVLSGGRLRLGIGIGWNWVEYEGLGVPYEQRGARQAEQIAVLRKLWTQPLVDFSGAFHTIRSAGLNPLPVQRPIPLWLGGMAEAVLQRVGAMADGWIPQFPSFDPTMVATLPRSHEEPAAMIARVRDYARQAGRDPNAVGIEGRIVFANRTEDDWGRDYEKWKVLGASHVAISTRRAALGGADALIAAVRRVRSVLPATLNPST